MLQYYIYKQGDRIVGYNVTERLLPPPAIPIDADEAKKMGIWRENPLPEQPPQPDSMYSELANAIIEGVNSV